MEAFHLHTLHERSMRCTRLRRSMPMAVELIVMAIRLQL
jgi:hypothetical protein